ncbi:MAG: TetR/AcrR family transcriptional regulator [Acidimicrobiia bacterium]|nr:TetR/AcrR family transcriptional regulator [Acidimicrobiia bacterium]MDH3396394.1 TetR/AcrR family transcriptional regulator [Acidimicrobiia bacterium]MDH5616587.1 TetR/AcrR family transcriptional regulator [Acidimicrobiia bacterium]
MEAKRSGPTPQEQIAEAALTLISERGLAGVTMSAVAREAGVARQTLYNHYPDLESIVTAAIEQHERLGLFQARQLLEGHEGAAAKLEQLIRHAVVMGAHGHAPASLESSLSPRAQEGLRIHRSHTREMVIEILEEGVAEGVFRPDLDPEIDAIFIQEVLVPGPDREEAADLSLVAGATVRFVLAAVKVAQG